LRCWLWLLQLLEVYALQIQMYTAQKDNKKLVSIYEKALRTKSGVAHPVGGGRSGNSSAG
jgi:hypothetical protein